MLKSKMNSNAPFSILIVFILTASAFGQRNLKDIPNPNPELQLDQFEVADGFEINLFASDPQLAKPIQMNFDSQGRLWVASSEVYPQIEPGQVANDKVLVMDDTDGDGQVDSTTVFAEGLLIPTGVLPGDGGCYVSNSTELLHMVDTDGDGMADSERVVLSGFGTEDTHHILHTLRWGPGCSLYMNQSIYIHSHIETPYGVRRMNGGGTWWFRPDLMRLETYTLGCCNPWGHAWDRYGVSFGTDGAYGEGINYYFPGFVGPTAPGAKRVVNGLNVGKPKLCSLEYIDGSHLPEAWRGNFIANDFRAHRVCGYVVEPSNGAFTSTEGEEPVKTRHVAFRPIDVKMGPDGAIYIADWYNPIIQHGEVDFRDERRDHTHGRIWRVTAKGRPLVPRINLEEQSTQQLCELLASPEPWQYQHAKQVLKHRDHDQTVLALNMWLNKQDPKAKDYYRRMLQVFWTCEAQNVIRHDLLDLLLRCKDDQARATATRVLYNWHDRIPNADEWLELLVIDPSARVRLEAVRATTQMDDPRACQIAMRALDYPIDRFLDFALWRTARDLQATWLPALDAGAIDFDGKTDHLTYALQAVETPDVASKLLKLAANESLSVSVRRNILKTVASSANDPNELRKVFDVCLDERTDKQTSVELLNALTDATLKRKVKPAGNLAGIAALLRKSSEQNESVLRAAGAWKIMSMRHDVFNAIPHAKTADEAVAGLDGLVSYGDTLSVNMLKILATGHRDSSIRNAAAARLMLLDPNLGSSIVVDRLQSIEADEDPSEMIRLTLASKEGPLLLVNALENTSIRAEVARASLNELGSSGLAIPTLVTALRKSGNLDNANGWKLTADQRNQFLAEVARSGDPAAGERIYRRAKMACQKCHAIGGAGGQVGPDLASIGASAQPDYILESLLEPSKKIKENYHSLIVVNDDGKVLTGIKLRETQDDLLLRNAEDEVFSIPLDSIDERADGGSLMPSGLVEGLTRVELVNLVRYLSELGKIGDYALPREKFVRSWEVLSNLSKRGSEIAETDFVSNLFDDASDWNRAYSVINGALPVSELSKWDVGGKEFSAVRFSINNSNPNAIIHINPVNDLRIWKNGQEIESLGDVRLSQSENNFVFLIDRKSGVGQISVELR